LSGAGCSRSGDEQRDRRDNCEHSLVHRNLHLELLPEVMLFARRGLVLGSPKEYETSISIVQVLRMLPK
jgi:hypothetical protein